MRCRTGEFCAISSVCFALGAFVGCAGEAEKSKTDVTSQTSNKSAEVPTKADVPKEAAEKVGDEAVEPKDDLPPNSFERGLEFAKAIDNPPEAVAEEAAIVNALREAGFRVDLDADGFVVGIDGYYAVVETELLRKAADLKRLRTVVLNLEGPTVGDLKLDGLSANDIAMLKPFVSLETLVLSGKELPPGAIEHIAQLEKLKELSLDQTQISDEDLAGLAGSQGIEELRLYSERITDDGLKYLEAFQKLSSITLSTPGVTGTGLAHLVGLPALRILDLSSTVIDGSQLVHLAKVAQLEELTPPQLLNDEGLGHVCRLPKLMHLDLSYEYKLTNEGAAALAGLDNLSVLLLNETDLTDAAMQHVGQIKTLTHLEVPKTIGDEGVAALAGLTELRELNLGYTTLTDKSMPHLLTMPKLETVYLTDTQITAKGLAGIHELKHLHTLGIVNTSIGDDAVPHIVKITQLKVLPATGTKLTHDGIRKIHAALPECDIRYD